MKMKTIAMAVATLCAAPVWAQTLEDVVISASRAQQRSFDAPAAIESVDRETIQGAGPQINLSESLNRVPGLTILNRQNYAQDLQVSIRGFGARSAFGIRGIRLLIDGIPATTPDGQGQGSSIALTSTDRIEVLRGPLALLYGNSAGGVIQAWTREAPEVPEFSVQGYVGSYGLRRSDVQMAGRVGTVGVVADYSTFSTDGYRDNSATERKQFNSKISFGPDAGTRVNLVFNHFDMPLAEDPAGLTAARLAVNPAEAGANTEARRVRKIVTQSQMGTSVNHKLDADRSITARAYYGTRDNLQFQTGVFGVTPNGAWVGLDRSYYGVGLQYNALSKLGEMPVRWVAGYEFDRSREYREGGAAALGEKTSTTRSEDNQAENSDVFAQGTALLSERWSLTGGLRHSTVRFVSEDYYLADGRDGSGQVRYSATNPVVGLTWHALDTLNVYANYGKGFETPTLAEVAYRESGGSVLAEFNPTLRAATSRHYEAGFKWVPGAGARLDATVFQVTTSDEVVVARNASGQTAFTNAPGTERRGVELAGRSVIHPHVSLSLAATAIDARYSQSFSYTSAGTPFTVLADSRMPGIPQHYIFSELLWSSQTLQLARSAQRTGSRAGIEVVSTGRLYANDSNTAVADGYTIVHLKASHGWAVGKGNLTAYARIDNVGDKAYVGSVIVNQAASQFYEPAPGRNWTLGARLNVPL